MEYKNFKLAVDAVRKLDKFMDKAGDIGINLIDSPFYDFEASMIKSLFAEIYGEDGEEWIEYYLWEVPFIKEPKAKQDGEPVDLTSDESFYKFLEEKYGKRN